ncbi:MAG: nickel pincer cofactor biosynthesis protein LarC [Oscillospiraceae bacterium]|nr:nickel pincer cofactor biosynthesis protein LarC [Oscillospiraceae bacterium]
MKTLYLDCGMGAAGDMLTAALTELMPDPDDFVERLNSLGIPDVEFSVEHTSKCGIIGTHMKVSVHGVSEGEEHHDHDHDHHGHDHEGHHSHTSMHDIEHIVGDLRVPSAVKSDILAVYSLIAEAESHAHGVPVSEIHFHEVGTMDAVADITAVCLAIHELSPDMIVASPVHVGYGSVECAHGILPVPAPATEYILRGVPIYGGSVKGELCTPTGAALLKHFVKNFGDMPVLRIFASGYGMGTKDFEQANCIRALIGESVDSTDTVTMLSCNIDDMSAEDISYAMTMLFAGGAMEVFTVPVGMKKSRMGTMLCVICNDDNKESILEIIFMHTSTIGVRESVTKRYVLDRHTETVNTPYGKIHRKISTGYGVSRVKYEHDDLERLAAENYVSIDEIRSELAKINDDDGE